MDSDCFHPIFQYADWQMQEGDGHYPVQPENGKQTNVSLSMMAGGFVLK